MRKIKIFEKPNVNQPWLPNRLHQIGKELTDFDGYGSAAGFLGSFRRIRKLMQ